MTTQDRLHQASISVRKSSIHGYGVFANEFIPEGSLIEECHAIMTQEPTHAFNNYLFEGAKSTESRTERSFILALGFGSIYNHADQCNSEYRFDDGKQLLRFFSVKDILPNEEICIHYGDAWFQDRGLKGELNPAMPVIKRSFSQVVSRFGLVCVGIVLFTMLLQSLLLI